MSEPRIDLHGHAGRCFLAGLPARTEILRLAEATGPDHVALGTDLDGNYKPVLTSYNQLGDLARLLCDRGLPIAGINGILGGNALALLTRILLQEVQAGQGN